jgi:hypothetical protein
MTDKEKIDKLDTLDVLRTRIGGCFGDQDKIFASHPFDEKRAKELRKLAEKNNITLEEMENIVTGYLFRSKVFSEHATKQTKKASAFFAKKLN